MSTPVAPNPLADALENPALAPQLAAPGEVGPERGEHDRPPFPLGGPVQCLGISADIAGSQKCYYLDYNGQLVGLEAGNRHGKNSLIALYGPQSDWLEAQWPQWSKPVREYDKSTKTWTTLVESQIVGFDQAEASRALIEECVRKGIFDPAGRMRGRGAHRIGGEAGHGNGLALHCGDMLLVSRMKADGTIRDWHWIDPGLHERYVYPAGEAIPRPWHEPAGEAPGMQVFGELQTWHWRRPLLDPIFVLGAIGLGFIGGWPAWRANIWITGGRGVGKSTLNGKDGLVHRLYGEGVLRTGNASAAYLRQRLRNSTVPVMIDEAEAGADNRKMTELIEMARLSSSGDSLGRGGADHVAHEFTLQSPFWFSSINRPPMEAQDLSRLALCELKPLPVGTPPIDLNKLNLPKLGRQLARRMIDGLHRLEATKLKFHTALAVLGHDSRACDQFGTLLACADLLMNDWADGTPADEALHDWVQLCRPERMTEISGAGSEEGHCIDKIITSPLQSRGGDEREAISTWLGRALHYVDAPLLNADPNASGENNKCADAARKLEQIGLKLVQARYHPAEHDATGAETKAARWGAAVWSDTEVPGFVAISWNHDALIELFKGSKWQGGVWKQPLARIEGAIDGIKCNFARAKLNATLVPLWAVFDDEELPAASRRAAALEWVQGLGGGGAT